MLRPRLKHLLCGSLLAGLSCLNHAAHSAEPSMLSYQGNAPDISASIAKLEQTPYYQIYQALQNSPLGPKLQKVIDEGKQGIAHKTPLSLEQWLQAFSSASFAFKLNPLGQPEGHFTLRFHDHANALWAFAANANQCDPTGTSIQLYNGPEIIRGKDDQGDFWQLRSSNGDQSLSKANKKQTNNAADLCYRTSFSLDAMTSAIRNELSADDQEELEIFTKIYHQIFNNPHFSSDLSLNITEQGIITTSETEHVKLELQAFDQRVIAALPQNTMLVLAAHLDGQFANTILDFINEVDSRALNGLDYGDAMLSEQGLPTITETITSLNGTAVIAITPSAPFPAATVILPRNEAIDQFIPFLTKQLNVDISQVARHKVAVPIPNGLPVTPYLRQSEQYWHISTDPALLDQLIQGGTSFHQSRIHQRMLTQTFKPHALFAFDLQEIARTGQMYLPMASMGIRSARKRDMLNQFTATLPSITPHLPVSLTLIGKSADKAIYYDENGISITAILAGMAIPRVSSARGQALELDFGNRLKQLFTGAYVYQAETGNFPLSLEEVVARYPEDYSTALLHHPTATHISPAFVYVRPVKAVAAAQLVVLANPAISNFTSAPAIMGDTSLNIQPLGFFHNYNPELTYQQLWDIAVELSESEKAQTTGIGFQDWIDAVSK